ncbi:hypothetical protein P154DRAFT_521291 [Amniculicola lignicola CBS 123094]|uniref:Uncharacterized protein n=1 Tax=Amniculicola lignicola CBS 123094 TaxID=1392246 RepID=A0A6A5WSX9_9PLEO|nr:hypothetical protein P154DRAFT_521291 [Amniculicola lignicola CBS 123094]
MPKRLPRLAQEPYRKGFSSLTATRVRPLSQRRQYLQPVPQSKRLISPSGRVLFQASTPPPAHAMVSQSL